MKSLRPVASVAKKYREIGLPFEDLTREGTIGLVKAVEKFDPDRSYRLAWIAISAMPRTATLDRTVAADGKDLEPYERVEDEEASGTAEAAIRDLETVKPREAVEQLPGWMRYVPIRRFDLEPANVSELAKELGLSRDQIRNFQRKAERMLTGGARRLHAVPPRDRAPS